MDYQLEAIAIDNDSIQQPGRIGPNADIWQRVIAYAKLNTTDTVSMHNDFKSVVQTYMKNGRYSWYQIWKDIANDRECQI